MCNVLLASAIQQSESVTYIYTYITLFYFFPIEVMIEYWVKFPVLYSGFLLLIVISFINGFSPWVGKIPWRRVWPPASVILPGESPWTEEPGRPTVHMVANSRTRLKRLYMHFTYISVYMATPVSQFIPPLLLPLVIISLFSMSVTLFLFWRFICTIF